MRKILLLAFLIGAIGALQAQNNITKTAGVNYTSGPPTFNPSQKTASEYAIDTTNGRFYQFHRTSAISGSWKLLPQGIDTIGTSVPPNYTPTRNMSWFAINAIDSLYRYSGVGTLWNCINCGGGGSSTAVVDTPIIGNGSPGNPLTIGQFGADTTKYLNWNGHHWYPAGIDFTDIKINLPYYLGDNEAIANGLMVGDPYLLKCDNDYSLPAGIFKVVKGCAFDCGGAIMYYPNDATAFANGIPFGHDYALSGTNIFGVLYGFIKAVASDTLSNDTLVCSTVLPFYPNDASALMGSLAIGDLYNMSQPNTYGAPWGTHRALSLALCATSADPPICCAIDATLPYFTNDTTAVAGGLSPGNYYYLAQANTYGYPFGTKKVIP